MIKYAIAIGNAFDGITLYGPFDDLIEATEHAEATYCEHQYEIVQLYSGEEQHPIVSPEPPY